MKRAIAAAAAVVCASRQRSSGRAKRSRWLVDAAVAMDGESCCLLVGGEKAADDPTGPQSLRWMAFASDRL